MSISVQTFASPDHKRAHDLFCQIADIFKRELQSHIGSYFKLTDEAIWKVLEALYCWIAALENPDPVNSLDVLLIGMDKYVGPENSINEFLTSKTLRACKKNGARRDTNIVRTQIIERTSEILIVLGRMINTYHPRT